MFGLNKKIQTGFSVLVCFMLMLGMVQTGCGYSGIDTARDVSLSVSYTYGDTAISGAVFNIYRVAEVSADAGYSITDAFKDYSVSLDNSSSEEWRNAAAAFAGYAARDNISSFDSGSTNAEGAVSFPSNAGSMKPGLYLVIANKCVQGSSTYTSEPYLICLPSIGDDGAWEYDVTCAPKVNESKIPTDDPTPPVPTQTSPPTPIPHRGRGHSSVDPVNPKATNPPEATPGDPTDATPENPPEATAVAPPHIIHGSDPVTPGIVTDTMKVMKVWSDEGHEDARPESVGVQLLCDGEIFAETELNEDNNWRYTWSDLDASRTWQVVEKNVPDNYTVAVDMEGTTGILINTYETEKTTGESGSTIPDTPGSVGENPGTTGTRGKLPQTGQLWWPVPVMAALGILLFAVGLNIRRGAGNE